jgi:hypothetical protein
MRRRQFINMWHCARWYREDTKPFQNKLHDQIDSPSPSYSRRSRVQLPARGPAKLTEEFLWYSLLPGGNFRVNTSNHSPAASFRILSNSLFTNDPFAWPHIRLNRNHHLPPLHRPKVKTFLSCAAKSLYFTYLLTYILTLFTFLYFTYLLN